MTTPILRGDEHHCLRPQCGNVWVSRTPGKVPKKCPKCQSPLWNRQPKAYNPPQEAPSDEEIN